MQTISIYPYLGLTINISYFSLYVFIIYVHKCKYVHKYTDTIYKTAFHIYQWDHSFTYIILAIVSLPSFILPCYQFQ